MGKLFPISAFIRSFILLIPLSFAHAEILLPEYPEADAPEAQDTDIRVRAESIRKQRKESSPKVAPMKAIKIELAELARQPANFDFFLQVSLVVPYITTTLPRKNYTVDLTSHMTMGFRANRTLDLYDGQLWWGLRLANFSGTGCYERTLGSYGFQYYGFVFAWVQIDDIPEDKPANEDEAKTARNEYPTRDASMFLFSVSVQNVTGSKDPTAPEVNRDFISSRGITWDIPGISFEYVSTRIYFGSVGISYLGGAQLGAGKTFFWLGAATSGWM